MNTAFGSPGIEPRWTNGAKDGIGTAYAASCHLWFTLWNGIVTEVYYPTIDIPQIRDLQVLVTDGKSFFHEEKRDLKSTTERLEESLGYRIVNEAPDGRYRIVKEVITDPHLPCVLVRCRLEGEPKFVEGLKLYVLCAPHLNACGWDNSGRVRKVGPVKLLAASKSASALYDADTHLALGLDVPMGATSIGFAGKSDGWQDLHDNFQLDWEFDEARGGNIALTGEILATSSNGVREWTISLGFGDSPHAAYTAVLQSLAVPYAEQREKFLEQWQRPLRHLLPLAQQASDGGRLFRASYQVLLSHEDKRYPGALIASLSIPWGEIKSDEDTGGYHLVWPRDMVNSATALLAAGASETALRALVYLAVSQNPDGSFAQNFWLDGTPYWKSLQLDEVAFPILLADTLRRKAHNGTTCLQTFDAQALVEGAARFLVLHGPCTPQERWEEASGMSPSTLAAVVAGLVAGGALLRSWGRESDAVFVEEYADWIEGNLDFWCVTDSGQLAGESAYYVRINPAQPGCALPVERPGGQKYRLASQAPDAQQEFEAREIVDGGFLELVRYGIRAADHPLIQTTVRVMDQVLRKETSRGIAYLRYNHDGYGQRLDGSAYHEWGTGHGWPLLTGERAHYELAAGGDIGPWIETLESLALPTGMISEQVWTAADLPEAHMFSGAPTGAAMPLAWAHSEYVKLLRSKQDGRPFDLVPEAFARYVSGEVRPRRDLTMWGLNYPVESMAGGHTLRIVNDEAFEIHWTNDGWNDARHSKCTSLELGVHYVDVAPVEGAANLEFTIYYPDRDVWQGKNFVVEIRE